MEHNWLVDAPRGGDTCPSRLVVVKRQLDVAAAQAKAPFDRVQTVSASIVRWILEERVARSEDVVVGKGKVHPLVNTFTRRRVKHWTYRASRGQKMAYIDAFRSVTLLAGRWHGPHPRVWRVASRI